MNDNAKYTSFEEIYSRVTSLVPNKQVNPADVMEWCLQCETEYIQTHEGFFRYVKAPIPVRDKMARVPPICARILDVYSDPESASSSVNYYHNGAYLILDGRYDKDTIYMNFLGLPIDEATGLPMILQGNEEACVAHIIHNLYFEDYLNGKIDQGRYNMLLENRNLQVRAAQSSFRNYDRKELRQILAISLNLTPMLNFDTLYHKGIGE